MTQSLKVALARCPDYSSRLDDVLCALLDKLGGLASFVKPGASVLVKPNLLSDRLPEQGVTTHPALVRSIIREVKKVQGKPFVADSPATATKLEQVWEKTGFRQLCKEEDVPLLNLEQAGSVHFEEQGFHFSIAEPVLNADVIINVPKVKTHVLTILTAAVKNTYGAVPGFFKTNLHKTHPRPAEFGRLILEVYKKVRPALNIADGVVGMDGDGPSGGQIVRLGFLAASSDAVALDLTLCRVLGVQPKAVPYLRPFLTNAAANDAYRTIELLGDDPAGLAEEPFHAPSTLRGQLIPGPIVKALNPLLWIRPRFLDHCVRCRRCIEACPAHALELVDTPIPRLDPRLCVGCCCCHEVCPENAVRMDQSPLLKLLRGGRPL